MSSKLNLRRASSTARMTVWCLSLLCAGAANAAEIHVYEGQSIQDAIDGASGGDEIIVHPGTYNECIDFLEKAITLRAENLSVDLEDPLDPAEASIIDGTNLECSVVTCDSGEGPDTLLDGFTVTGGHEWDWGYGGGMYINDSSPTITNCVFSANYAWDVGGGVYIGGASSPAITNCSFLDNYADYGGGGMYVDWEASVHLTDCIFLDNSTYDYGGGLYQSSDHVTSTIVNCLFAGNSAYWEYGGLYLSNATMTNCTVTGNTASDYYGGAVADDACTLTNCIFWGNTGDGWNDDLYTWGGAVVTYCDIGISSFEYYCDGESNICVDPAFEDPQNDIYRLGPGSSCADVGSDAAVPPGVDTDLDGKARFVDADADGQATVDIGAYEFQETCYGVQLAVPSEYATIQEAIDAACFNDEIVVAPGTYQEVVNLRGKPITLRSSGGPAVTAIDATGLDSSVVLCVGGEGPDTIIEGFTITGGAGTLYDWDYWGDIHHGGGMLIAHAGPTINDCRFVANAVTDEYARGGAVFIAGGDPVFTNCLFTDNSATDGGAVCAEESDYYYDYYCYYQTSNPTFAGCEFSSNLATNDGGAIMIGYGCSLDLSGSTFSANSADDDGGALALDDTTAIIVSDCVFTGNTANESGGAALWWDGGDVTFTGCDFIDNQALAGGAIDVEESECNIEYCTFTGNTAVFAGGAVFIDDGVDAAVSNCDFSLNFAMYGGAIFCDGDDDNYSINLTDCTFTTNDAGYGGGLYCYEIGQAMIVGCDFIDNTAFRAGGLGLYFAFVEVIDCSFQDNAVLEYGGGISNWDGYLAVGTTLFCSNDPDHLEGPYADAGGNEFLDECPSKCPADLNNDGKVNIDDLFIILGAWGTCDNCPEDLTGDGKVNIDDLFVILGEWGPCPGASWPLAPATATPLPVPDFRRPCSGKKLVAERATD